MMMRSLRPLMLCLLTVLCSGLMLAWPVKSALAVAEPIPKATMATSTDVSPAHVLFDLHCAGCHVGGGNIVRRRKTLKQRALQRNGVDSVAAIAQLITQGKGAMSAYGDRLTPPEVELLAQYVWQQSQNDWQ